MDWRELETFKGVDLEDSFVLEWKQSEDEIEITIEASLWPESPHYLKPKPNEHTCYRKAALRFSGFSKIKGLKAIESVSPVPSNIEEEPDYGNIGRLVKTAGGFEVEGAFGEVEIEGGRVWLVVGT